MFEWCMAHPFLTFWILFFGVPLSLGTIESVVESVSKIFWKEQK